jgi:peroxiredoxin (alkyl hydroperoxide reductase subunit C)
MEETINHFPLLGDPFPSLTVQTTHGVKNIPEDYKGSWFILFSHPGDFTPVCTTEFHAFQQKYDEFEKLNCKLIGMSVDQVQSHIKWIEWIKENFNTEIQFPVIAGTEDIARQLGMIHKNKGTNTVRAVFIVDPEGINRLVLYYPQEIGRNIDEVLRALKALQISDENKVAIPANWPNNELMKDDVIIPPAKTVDEAKERLESKDYECYDWWLCHKKI